MFKTLQTYGDGRIDRWIGLDDSGDNGHGHGHPTPAPALDLAPAEPGATPISPSPTEKATTPAPTGPHRLSSRTRRRRLPHRRAGPSGHGPARVQGIPDAPSARAS
ncbi:hypothetical protein AB0O86_27210 [Streptomyces hirsutus]|uniref:hypothetical protein n=1 Tax=Streptomyces hirsutus TaxID=35620 RepID=UPI0034312E00